MESTIEFRILGPLEVWREGGSLPLGGLKQRSLLALLLLQANQVVSTDRLVHELWGDEPPGTAVTALHGYVSQLRKLIEPERTAGGESRVLVTRPPGYVLNVGPGQLDLDRFEASVRHAREELVAGPPGACGARPARGVRALARLHRWPISRASRSHRARRGRSRSSGWRRSRIASRRTSRSGVTARSPPSSRP